MSFAFAIVGKGDSLLFYHSLVSPSANSPHLNQFLIHSALDSVDECDKGESTSCYLGCVEKFQAGQGKRVHAYVSPGNLRFLLLIDGPEVKNESLISDFFVAVHRKYLELFLNPFFKQQTQIRVPGFKEGVEILFSKIK
eukprot:gnl/Carplike_NY0171/20461_a33217_80.p1 GENE.gnl/Carplike_NY0171/20461_a33217_80~~gnl/Carplike_NY0171/20461_a33217_80.p1  ORF type:complete len:139 (+),score=5.01 gnl/Carplike_NY0171/20461_a33217_80:41-457(+)